MTATLRLTRRRAIAIVAAAAGLAALPSAGRATVPRHTLYRWTGDAMGARASIALLHPDRDAAEHIVTAAVAEVRRLEEIFSLFRPASAVVRLNRDGRLDAPPLDLVALLRAAEAMSSATRGAFDATVQPLWHLYRHHFSAPGADRNGPSAPAIEACRHLIDHGAVVADSGAVAFRRPGMSITLNGIAQGFVTDRVADVLRARGAERVLLDLGEIRALGAAADGTPWRIGVEGTDVILPVTDMAVATSAGRGTVFDAAGRFHHLFDPRDGRCAARYRSVTVTAPTATVADGLSTALSVVAPHDAVEILKGFSRATAHFILADGRVLRIGA